MSKNICVYYISIGTYFNTENFEIKLISEISFIIVSKKSQTLN